MRLYDFNAIDEGNTLLARLPTTALPSRLKLSEAIGLLAEQLECDVEHAQDLLERAIRGHSLRNILSFHVDGSELPTDVGAWQEIEFSSGIVKIEASFGGSPITYVSIFPLLDRDELFKTFKIGEPKHTKLPPRRGGRPTQYDWDAFWVEVCYRVEKNGLPEAQSTFVHEMLEWFADQGNEDIDESTIRKKITKLYDVLKSE